MTTTTMQAPYLDADPAVFRERFDRKTFGFRHSLADHPLFAMPRLIELVHSLADKPGEVYFDAGNVRVDQRWDQVPVTQLSVEQLLERIEHSGAWIVVRHAERDPAYAAVLNDCMAEAESLANRRFRAEMARQHAIIFITSPNRVTPYHIDAECNFILQVRGTKTIHVFDRDDREILTEQELERFWAGDNNSAVYKPQYQSRAIVYDAQPGVAIHVPVNCPHWVQNGAGISVTLSVNFWYRDTSRTDVYRANYFLRQAGLTPQPPGSSVRDAVKRGMLPSFVGLRNVRDRFAKGRVAQ